MPALFIKSFGHAGTPVPPNWIATGHWHERLSFMWFPKYPRSVSRGSRLIYYAAGTRRFCAVVEVTGDEPTDTGHPRWPYQLAVRPIVAIPADEYAPTLEDVECDPLRVRRQSHVRLTRRSTRGSVTRFSPAREPPPGFEIAHGFFRGRPLRRSPSGTPTLMPSPNVVGKGEASSAFGPQACAQSAAVRATPFAL